jgi:hypothetical protein
VTELNARLRWLRGRQIRMNGNTKPAVSSGGPIGDPVGSHGSDSTTIFSRNGFFVNADYDAQSLGRALQGKRCGRGWLVRCVAHDDKSPSLRIDPNPRGGLPLLKCWAGCPQDAVVAALRDRGLWPERARREWTHEEKRAWARQRAETETASLWKRAKVHELEAAKAEALSVANRRASFQAVHEWGRTARALYVTERLAGATLLAAYTEALNAQPCEVRRLVAWARSDDGFSRRLMTVIVAILTVAERRAAA